MLAVGDKSRRIDPDPASHADVDEAATEMVVSTDFDRVVRRVPDGENGAAESRKSSASLLGHKVLAFECKASRRLHDILR
jgi:hypothetical protein